MVASWFIAISLRIRSLALTPIASERLRMLIGGSSSTWDFRAVATAARWPPRAFLLPERVRRTSSSSTRSAEAGTGEVTRRSPARSLRRARRPARSAAEPRRPVLFLLVFLLDRRRLAGAVLADRAREQGHGAARAPPGTGPRRAASRRRARRRAAADRGGIHRRARGLRLRRLESRSVDPTASRPASLPWSSTCRGAGSWAAGPRAPGAAVRRHAAARRGLRPRGARAGAGPPRDSRRPPSAPVSPPSRRGPADARRRRGADPRGHGADSRRRHVVARLQGLEARGCPRRRRRRPDGADRLWARGAGRCRDAACAPRAGRRRAGSRKTRPSGARSGAGEAGDARGPVERLTALPTGASTPGAAPIRDGDEPGISRCGAGAAGTAAARPRSTRPAAGRDEPEPGRRRRDRSSRLGSWRRFRPARARRRPSGPTRRGHGARTWARQPNSRPPCRTPADSSTP